MNINTATKATELFTIDELQVSGLKTFPGYRWREGILYYLNGVWSNRHNVMHRPSIRFSVPTEANVFSSMALRMRSGSGTYYLDGAPIPNNRMPRFTNEQIITASLMRADAEQGLIRLVKDDRIRAFIVVLNADGELRLWKSEERARLNIQALGTYSKSQP